MLGKAVVISQTEVIMKRPTLNAPTMVRPAMAPRNVLGQPNGNMERAVSRGLFKAPEYQSDEAKARASERLVENDESVSETFSATVV